MLPIAQEWLATFFACLPMPTVVTDVSQQECAATDTVGFMAPRTLVSTRLVSPSLHFAQGMADADAASAEAGAGAESNWAPLICWAEVVKGSAKAIVKARVRPVPKSDLITFIFMFFFLGLAKVVFAVLGMLTRPRRNPPGHFLSKTRLILACRAALYFSRDFRVGNVLLWSGSGLASEPERHMNTNPKKDPLDAALADWRVREPLPPRFQEQVWRRIADAGAEARMTPWTAFENWLRLAFARPAIALACGVVLLGVGSGTGWWQAREKSAHIQSELGSRYVQSLDPYRKMQM